MAGYKNVLLVNLGAAVVIAAVWMLNGNTADSLMVTVVLLLLSVFNFLVGIILVTLSNRDGKKYLTLFGICLLIGFSLCTYNLGRTH